MSTNQPGSTKGPWDIVEKPISVAGGILSITSSIVLLVISIQSQTSSWLPLILIFSTITFITAWLLIFPRIFIALKTLNPLQVSVLSLVFTGCVLFSGVYLSGVFDLDIGSPPKSYEELLKDGEQYLQQNEISRAIKAFSQAIQLNPNRSTAYAHRALALERMGDSVTAIADCEKSLHINPNGEFEHFNCGIVFTAVQAFDKAISSYTSILRVRPANGPVYYQLGRAYQLRNQQGDRDRAIANYHLCLELLGDNHEDYFSTECRKELDLLSTLP